MESGFSSHLTSVYIWTVLACTWLALKHLSWPIALSISLLRPTISLLFFAVWDDGRWLMLDDVTYFNHSAVLLAKGYNPFTVLATSDGFDYICGLSGGSHILYTWYNLVVHYVFGIYYFTPVFANIFLSFVAGDCFAKILKETGGDSRYCAFGQIYFLLHWDVIAWTSFVNLKDMLVLTLTMAAFLSCIRLIRTRSLWHVIPLGGICFLFLWIRFYVPVLIATSCAAWLITQWRDQRKYLLAPVAIVCVYLGLPMVVENAHQFDTQDIFYGCFRFIFTPVPWRVEDGHSFLVIPAVCHWLMGIPALIGGWALWKSCPTARLALLYLFILIGLYGIAEELQGPRHRFQVAFVLIWVQLQFIWEIRPLAQRSACPELQTTSMTLRSAA